MQRTPFAGVTIGRTAETHICNRFHVRFAALAVCAVLAGCDLAPKDGMRDLSAPFAATTRFEADRFSGSWIEVANFVAEGQPEPGQARRFWTNPETGKLVMSQGSAWTVFDVTGPGQLQPSSRRDEPVWVLWVDEGFRTAIMGSPSGADTVILDRSADPAPDRIAAARAILDWYGYDMTKLREIRQ